MNHDLSSLSEQELADLLSAASKTLGLKRDAHKREMIATIRELAKPIGVDVEIREAGIKAAHDKRAAVPIKYRDPHDPKHTWSGRGVKPRWMRALLDHDAPARSFGFRYFSPTPDSRLATRGAFSGFFEPKH